MKHFMHLCLSTFHVDLNTYDLLTGICNGMEIIDSSFKVFCTAAHISIQFELTQCDLADMSKLKYQTKSLKPTCNIEMHKINC